MITSVDADSTLTHAPPEPAEAMHTQGTRCLGPVYAWNSVRSMA